MTVNLGDVILAGSHVDVDRGPEAGQLGVLHPLQQGVALLPGQHGVCCQRGVDGTRGVLYHHKLLTYVVQMEFLVVAAAPPSPTHRRHIC